MADGMEESSIDQLNLNEVKSTHLEILPAVRYSFLRTIEFYGYIALSMIIHVFMLVAGKCLLTAESVKKRYFTD